MKLYYSKGACSLSIRILIHELNIPCEFEAVNLKEKKTETGQDYYQINPKGAVPAVVLDNQEILTENVAIHQYLADINRATSLFPLDFNRYKMIEWLAFVSTDLHKSFGPLFNPEVPEEVKEQVFKKILKNKLDFLNKHLANHKYIMGENYSLPDGYLFTVLRWAPHFKIELNNWPNIVRYFELMKTRPAVQQSLKEEGLNA